MKISFTIFILLALLPLNGQNELCYQFLQDEIEANLTNCYTECPGDLNNGDLRFYRAGRFLVHNYIFFETTGGSFDFSCTATTFYDEDGTIIDICTSGFGTGCQFGNITTAEYLDEFNYLPSWTCDMVWPSESLPNGGSLEGGPFEFCTGDGVVDTIAMEAITLSGNVGDVSEWVVTDDQGFILGLPSLLTAVDFDVAGVGNCQIWNISYEGTIIGLSVGQNVNDIEGCFGLSNPISVIRSSATSDPPCVIVGCIDPTATNYNPDATMSNDSCAYCCNGMQDGEETGIDCGGPVCKPCNYTLDCSHVDTFIIKDIPTQITVDQVMGTFGLCNVSFDKEISLQEINVDCSFFEESEYTRDSIWVFDMTSMDSCLVFYYLKKDGICDCNNPEVGPLLSFYRSTGGPNWMDKEGWDRAALGLECDPCNNSQTNNPWHGISCDQSGTRVVQIELNDNQLSGIVRLLPMLTELNDINISDNNLIGGNWNFSNSKLEQIDISNNPQLTSQIPNFTLPQLQRLYCFGNALEGPLPPFNQVPQLTDFFAFNNNISGLIPDYELPNLVNLSLAINNLTGPMPSLSQSTQLITMFVDENNLTGPLLDYADKPLLDTFILANNNLSGCMPTNRFCTLGRFDATDNPLLPFQGDYTQVCPPLNMPQEGAPCGMNGDSMIINCVCALIPCDPSTLPTVGVNGDRTSCSRDALNLTLTTSDGGQDSIILEVIDNPNIQGESGATYPNGNGTLTDVLVNNSISGEVGQYIAYVARDGCYGDTTVIFIDLWPDVEITTEDYTICVDSCQVLEISISGGSGAGYQFLWSDGQDIENPTVCPSSTTAYGVIVTDDFGCSASAFATVEVESCDTPFNCPSTIDSILCQPWVSQIIESTTLPCGQSGGNDIYYEVFTVDYNGSTHIIIHSYVFSVSPIVEVASYILYTCDGVKLEECIYIGGMFNCGDVNNHPILGNLIDMVTEIYDCRTDGPLDCMTMNPCPEDEVFSTISVCADSLSTVTAATFAGEDPNGDDTFGWQDNGLFSFGPNEVTITVDANCSYTQMVTINQLPVEQCTPCPADEVFSPISVCADSLSTVTAATFAGEDPNGDGTLGWQDNGPFSFGPNEVTVTVDANCSYTQMVTINELPVDRCTPCPADEVFSPVSVCADSLSTVTAGTFAGEDPNGDGTIGWQDNGAFSFGPNAVTITVDANCSYTQMVTINQLPVEQCTPCPADEVFTSITICQDSLSTIDLNTFTSEDPNGDGTFGWQIPTNFAFGMNSVNVIESNGCAYSQTVEIVAAPEDDCSDIDTCDFTLSDDDLLINETGMYQVNILENDDIPFEFTLSIISISDPKVLDSLMINETTGIVSFISNQAFFVPIEIAYEVCATDCSECQKAVLTITNTTFDDIIPTTLFSPNDDGIDDVLRFSNEPEIPESKLWIYNRWGNQIYFKENYTNDWEGKGYPGGVYFYVLEVRGVVLKRQLTLVK